MKNWLKTVWAVQSARLDAMSLRERVFLFLVVIVCCVALADTFWLSPAQLQQRQLSQRLAVQSADLQRTRETLRNMAVPSSASNAMREELAGVKSRQEAISVSIKEVMPQTSQSVPLPQVLVHLLRRHEGLTMVRTATLPADGAGKTASPRSALVQRQGIELTVSGPYAELARYVQTLERSLPYVRWGDMKLKGDKPSPELTLQLYLVGILS